MHYSLEWFDRNGERHVLVIKDRIFIGRMCKGVAEDKRILINDTEVSRDHATLTLLGHVLTVRDSSRNGLRVNGVRITSGVEHPLHHGDTLSIGGSDLSIRGEEGKDSERGEQELDETRTLALHEVVTHLVADLRGFSTITQVLDSSLIYIVMRELFDPLSEVVYDYHGTVKDYAGDAIFAFWEHGEKEHSQPALEACRAAIEQQIKCQDVIQGLASKYDGLDELELGWGIATGIVTLSHYGMRNDNVAVVGDATNLAFRLSGLANKLFSSPFVICSRTAELVKGELSVTDLGEAVTKGRQGTEHVYGLEIPVTK